MNRPIFLSSFFSTQSSGSKFFTSPAMRQSKPVASKCVTGPIPHFPACRPRHTDRKSTRLNSSHPSISYAVFCLKKKRGRPPHFQNGIIIKLLIDQAAFQLAASFALVACGDAVLQVNGRSFFFNKRATADIHHLSLHDALPI